MLSKNDILFDPGLDVFTRILLSMDGTLTHCLEAIFLERMVLAQKVQEKVDSCEYGQELDLSEGETILKREIVLKGEKSGVSLLHAVSYMLLDRVDPGMRSDLIDEEMTLGHIWIKHRAELYKEFIRLDREIGENDSVIFPGEPVLNVRTYKVFSRGTPVFVITERFPDFRAQRYSEKTAVEFARPAGSDDSFQQESLH